MSQDAIVMLKADHKEVRGLFREFQKASTTPARKGKLVEKIIELLTVHTYIENEVMYPRVRALLPDLEDDVLESYEEHHVADLLVMELVPMTWKDERFVAKATVLIENVEHHIEEEEQDWFRKVREGLTRTQLREIGAELLEGLAPETLTDLREPLLLLLLDVVPDVLDEDGRLGVEPLRIWLHPDQLHHQDVGDVVLLVGLQDVVLELGQERADAWVHDLVLEVGVDCQLLDDPVDEPALGREGLVPGLLEGSERLADLSVLVLEQDDGVGGHGSPRGRWEAARTRKHPRACHGRAG